MKIEDMASHATFAELALHSKRLADTTFKVSVLTQELRTAYVQTLAYLLYAGLDLSPDDDKLKAHVWFPEALAPQSPYDPVVRAILTVTDRTQNLYLQVKSMGSLQLAAPGLVHGELTISLITHGGQETPVDLTTVHDRLATLIRGKKIESLKTRLAHHEKDLVDLQNEIKRQEIAIALARKELALLELE